MLSKGRSLNSETETGTVPASLLLPLVTPRTLNRFKMLSKSRSLNLQTETGTSASFSIVVTGDTYYVSSSSISSSVTELLVMMTALQHCWRINDKILCILPDSKLAQVLQQYKLLIRREEIHSILNKLHDWEIFQWIPSRCGVSVIETVNLA